MDQLRERLGIHLVAVLLQDLDEELDERGVWVHEGLPRIEEHRPDLRHDPSLACRSFQSFSTLVSRDSRSESFSMTRSAAASLASGSVWAAIRTEASACDIPLSRWTRSMTCSTGAVTTTRTSTASWKPVSMINGASNTTTLSVSLYRSTVSASSLK